MNLKKVIIGNEKIAEILERSYRRGRLSHAYLFEGPEHIGKKTLALGFCQLLLGCDKEKIQGNVDLTIIRPDEESLQITVEKIRELQRTLSFYPYYSKYKVAIIEEAEKMNKAAANALLKTLEEPNETTILILLTSEAGNLLDTIKSRCQILKFLPVKKSLLKKFFQSTKVEAVDSEKIIEIAGCKPGKIVELIADKNKITKLEENINELLDIIEKSEYEKIEKAEIISANDIKEIIDMLDVWTIYFRRILIEEYKNGSLIRKNVLVETKKCIDLISKTKKDLLRGNINTRLAIENLLLQM